jgi:hypothetical protein
VVNDGTRFCDALGSRCFAPSAHSCGARGSGTHHAAARYRHRQRYLLAVRLFCLAAARFPARTALALPLHAASVLPRAAYCARFFTLPRHKRAWQHALPAADPTPLRWLLVCLLFC